MLKIKKKKVGLIHRSQIFRAHKDSIKKIENLQKNNKILFYTNAEVTEIGGKDTLEYIQIKQKNKSDEKIFLDYWFPLFGLIPKLGVVENWGLDIEKNAIKVNNALDYQTNIKGIFAVGDINTYPGKLKLILSGFHEATLAIQSAYKIIYPNKNNLLKYTTVSGIKGFKK